MTIKIRKAEPADVESLCYMLSCLFSIEIDFTVNKAKQERGLSMIIGGDVDGVILIAEDDTDTIGMVSLQRVVSTAAGGYSILLEDMFIMPEYRRSGLGSMFVKDVVRWGKENGALRIQLAADKRNISAINFYSAEGFESGNMICLYKYFN